MQQTFSDTTPSGAAPAPFWTRAWRFLQEDPSASGATLHEERLPRPEDEDRLERDESFYWGLAPGGL
jgi:hypothetical protein